MDEPVGTISFTDHRRVIESLHQEYRMEIGKMGMQLVRYRMALEKAGIEPPDSGGEELLKLWRDCATVVTTASEFVARLGTAKELITDWSVGATR